MPLEEHTFTRGDTEWVTVSGIISTDEELAWAERMIPAVMKCHIHVVDAHRPADSLPEACDPTTGVLIAHRPVVLGTYVSWTAVKVLADAVRAEVMP